ncbi:MAG TPA: NADH-dependent [FeFe] hydrogenase, group A6, partial [Armatimonadota bacterium]|nr:NADH-dependent [FeFe] hydrogenase, group A6 [Armatimonadota bacterium]
GIDIPTLCYLEDLFPSGACRMCVVEVEGARGLVPSCAFPAAEGQVVYTHSPRARRARKTIVELLLANHPQECLTCVRSGNCELQKLAQDLGVRETRYEGMRREYHIDASSVSLVRDPEKCILCGRCVRVCEEVQGVAAIDFTNRGFQTVIMPAFNKNLSNTACVNCGQCILVCPTGALREQSYLKEVWDAINDPEKVVVAQVAPAIRATIGEEFDMEPGTRVTGKLAAALRRAGFDKVFDTDVAADLTIMEEGSELVHRLTTNGTLPMITSCSPGWVKFIEHFYPELTDHLSTAKSPHMMLGALLKTYYAEKEGIDPGKIVVVSIMPCTAKKFEAQRPELENDGYQDVDYVLTTRETARLIKLAGLKFQNLPDEEFDQAFGTASGAAVIFGNTGGVMEAALRTTKFLLTAPAGEVPDKVTSEMLAHLDYSDVRGLEGVKEAEVDMNGIKLKIAVAHGLLNARTLLEQIKNGTSPYQFIEVMGCPGGCIGGGGSPMPTTTEIRKKRAAAIYTEDEALTIRASHDNPIVKQLYEEYLGKPLGEKSHELLHTHYTKRGL